jgi:phosphoglycerate-specific signal transduction histidine kinase
MILAMPVRNDDKTLSRKQRLQEKQRRQLAVVDTVDKAEAKVRKAEVELAGAVTEAVQVFGDEQSASEELDMPVEAIRRFLAMAQDEAAGAGDAVGAS